MARGKTLAPPSSSTLQSTRQMLDELDSIMERMLALPVGDTEEPAAPREEHRAPAPAATMTLVAPEPPPSVRTPRPAPRPAPPPRLAVPELPPAPPIAPAPLPAAVLPATQMPQLTTLLEEIPAPAPARWTWCLLPLLWCNLAYDRCTQPLGGLGAWMREPNGRTVVGATGTALLILSAICLLRWWLGWTW